jgi:hypothetical protein
MTNYSKECSELFMQVLVKYGKEEAANLVTGFLVILEQEANIDLNVIAPIAHATPQALSVTLLNQFRRIFANNAGFLKPYIEAEEAKRAIKAKESAISKDFLMDGIKNGDIKVVNIGGDK